MCFLGVTCMCVWAQAEWQHVYLGLHTHVSGLIKGSSDVIDGEHSCSGPAHRYQSTEGLCCLPPLGPQPTLRMLKNWGTEHRVLLGSLGPTWCPLAGILGAHRETCGKDRLSSALCWSRYLMATSTRPFLFTTRMEMSRICSYQVICLPCWTLWSWCDQTDI